VAFRRAAESVAEAKLRMLTSTDEELIDLDNARCSSDADEVWIRSKIRGHERKITLLVVKHIRDVFCGVNQVRDDATVAPGSLNLSLVDTTIDLSSRPRFESPLLLLQFAGWLRLLPRVVHLTVSPRQMTERGIHLLQTALLAERAALPCLQAVRVVDDPNDTLCWLKELVTQVASTAFLRRGSTRSLLEVVQLEDDEPSRTFIATFSEGPIGMTIKRVRRDEASDMVVVISVDSEGQAVSQGVQVGSVVLEVAKISVRNAQYEEVRRLLNESERPMRVLLQESMRDTTLGSRHWLGDPDSDKETKELAPTPSIYRSQLNLHRARAVAATHGASHLAVSRSATSSSGASPQSTYENMNGMQLVPNLAPQQPLSNDVECSESSSDSEHLSMGEDGHPSPIQYRGPVTQPSTSGAAASSSCDAWNTATQRRSVALDSPRVQPNTLGCTSLRI